MQWKRADVARKSRNVCALAAVLALSAFSVQGANSAEVRGKGGKAAAESREFRVNITGWTSVNSSPNCMLGYTAHVTGGSGGYTYEWQTTATVKNQWDNFLQASFSPAGTYDITVFVTDLNGEVAEHTIPVISSDQEYECYG